MADRYYEQILDWREAKKWTDRIEKRAVQVPLFIPQALDTAPEYSRRRQDKASHK